MRGPIDYIIVSFEGNKFDGSVLKAIGDAIDAGTIALVELVLAVKDADGSLSLVDISESGDDTVIEFAQKYPSDTEVFSQDDVDEMGELLEPNSSAGLLVIEQLWAKPLKEALIAANGALVAEGRIHPDAAAELNAEGAK